MITSINKCLTTSSSQYPLYLSTVKAGFPSPADDYIEKTLDLNEHLIKHPTATFFVRVKGDSMINAGIFSNDILVVDRSLEAVNNDVVLAVFQGEFTVKRFCRQRDCLYLLPENPLYQPIKIQNGDDFEVWGVVIHVIHSFRAA